MKILDIVLIILTILIVGLFVFSWQKIMVDKEYELQIYKTAFEEERVIMNFFENISRSQSQQLAFYQNNTQQNLSNGNSKENIGVNISYNTICFTSPKDYQIYVRRVGDTGSMYPTIKNWSYLLTTSNIDNLTVGDIIFFRKDGDWIAHRIAEIKIKNVSSTSNQTNQTNQTLTEYYTKGDNNENMDWGFITQEDIRSKIIGVIY